jgi:hypothetical protein
MDVLSHIVLSAALVAGIITLLKWAAVEDSEAQALDRLAAELRELVEEQHPVVRQGSLMSPDRRSSSWGDNERNRPASPRAVRYGSEQSGRHGAFSACSNPVRVTFPVVADEYRSQIRAVSPDDVQAVRGCVIDRREGPRRVQAEQD